MQYDIVLNGREIASGSIRIVDRDLQNRVFAAIGIDEEEARRTYQVLMDLRQLTELDVPEVEETGRNPGDTRGSA